jgi:hypothetical protein
MRIDNMKKFAFLILAILLLSACGPKEEDQVLGTWERVDGEIWLSVAEVDLAAEDQAVVTTTDGGKSPYEWSIEDGDFCASWDSPQLICYQMELNGDTLTLLDLRDQSVTLKRVE